MGNPIFYFLRTHTQSFVTHLNYSLMIMLINDVQKLMSAKDHYEPVFNECWKTWRTEEGLVILEF